MTAPAYNGQDLRAVVGQSARIVLPDDRLWRQPLEIGSCRVQTQLIERNEVG